MTFCRNCDASENPAVQTVKNYAKSPLFLTAAIFLSLSVLFSLIQTVIGNGSIFESLHGFAYDVFGSRATGLINAVETTAFVSRLVFCTPALLIAVGLWMIYASARNSHEPGIRTAGLTWIQSVVIAELVFCCLATVLAAITIWTLMILGTTAFNFFEVLIPGFSGYAYALLIAAFIAFVIAAVLVILFFAGVLSSLATAKRVARSGTASDKVSRYVAILLFLSCASGFSLLAGDGIIDALSALCNAIASACFGILIFRFKTAMRRIMVQNRPEC